MVNQLSDEDSYPEERSDEGPLFQPMRLPIPSELGSEAMPEL